MRPNRPAPARAARVCGAELPVAEAELPEAVPVAMPLADPL